MCALGAWGFTSSWGLARTACFTPALCLSLRSWQCLLLLCFAFLPFAHMPNAVADGSDMLHVLDHCSVLMLHGGRVHLPLCHIVRGIPTADMLHVLHALPGHLVSWLLWPPFVV